MEAMVNSDNVVRGGLTPKFKDTKTLVEVSKNHPLTFHFNLRKPKNKFPHQFYFVQNIDAKVRVQGEKAKRRRGSVLLRSDQSGGLQDRIR